ncbi:hypothetical protein ACFFF5_04950 [Lederbergia wuyishanensis]|uniref:Lipoprotein n=1 Tax=Lederbergia wuyishanensis TaxID=1347903 RepID=A0ABU0CZ55_9BACI|nr:hypothetical protein [Lederbergia wuyishanensis]MCJ8006068.1 hypothetical protein [Lederbergia wuyishanensis]MDQ0341437.1 hypothetical protein [Lederbergia wuyishanensis]
MLKSIKIVATCFLAILLLAACGTTGREANLTNGSGAGGNQEEKSSPAKEEKIVEETDKDNTEVINEEVKEDEQEDTSDKIRLFEMNLTYEVNKEKKEDTAFLRSSDQQDYSLYILPEFELTAEEPNKDVLYLKENDRHFMRIEILPSETNMDDAVSTIKEQLTAVNSEVTQLEVKNSPWLENAHIYQAEKDVELVTAYLLEKDNLILKLTVFTTKEQNYLDPFLKMAETIEKK